MRETLYLASASARRRDILRSMKIRFRRVRSRYRERFWRDLGPVRTVRAHALGKAEKALLPQKARFVMGADTIVFCRGKILGKPKSLSEARNMLALLSGRRHWVYTGIALLDRARGLRRVGHAKTAVFFRKLTARDIERYIAAVDPLDKAGAYAIQAGPRVVRKIEGSYSNVVGLPRELVRKMLRGLGLSV